MSGWLSVWQRGHISITIAHHILIHIITDSSSKSTMHTHRQAGSLPPTHAFCRMTAGCLAACLVIWRHFFPLPVCLSVCHIWLTNRERGDTGERQGGRRERRLYKHHINHHTEQFAVRLLVRAARIYISVCPSVRLSVYRSVSSGTGWVSVPRAREGRAGRGTTGHDRHGTAVGDRRVAAYAHYYRSCWWAGCWCECMYLSWADERWWTD